MREKLIELINAVLRCLPWGEISSHTADDVADHLIANGVIISKMETVATDNNKWIPVTERLPNPGDYVLVCDTREDWYGLWEFSGVAWYDASYQPWGIDEVTHWMPLPEPPKGE